MVTYLVVFYKDQELLWSKKETGEVEGLLLMDYLTHRLHHYHFRLNRGDGKGVNGLNLSLTGTLRMKLLLRLLQQRRKHFVGNRELDECKNVDDGLTGLR